MIQQTNISVVYEEILTDVFNQVNFLHVFIFDIRHPFNNIRYVHGTT